MQAKSLFVFAILLVASPSMYACTVTDGADESDDNADSGVSDESADDNSSDDTTDEGDDTADEGDDTTTEGDDTADEGDDTADESDETATTDEDGGTDAPEGDGGDVTEPEEGDGGAVDSDGGDETTEEGDGGSDETTEEGDGGGEEPEGDAAAPSGDTIKSGSVGLSQLIFSVLDVETVSANANAGFSITTYDGPFPDQAALPCVVTTEGSCSLSVCDFSDQEPAPEGPGSTSKAVSAGDVTITGLSEEVVLSSDDNGSYTAASGTSRYWEGGETVVVSAPGSDDVPEFSIELTAPSDVSITDPEITLGVPVGVSRAEPFEVAWSEGDDGTISVSLIDGANDAELTRMITCTVPASAGGVTVDESLLEGFSDDGAISVSISAAAAATVEDWSLSVSASGTLASGTVAFTD